MTGFEVLYAILLDLKENGPTIRFYGICNHVREAHRKMAESNIELEELSALMVELFRDWPEFTGDPEYPVPSPIGLNPEYTYSHTGDMWVGEYGDTRSRLLDYLLDTLRKISSMPGLCG